MTARTSGYDPRTWVAQLPSTTYQQILASGQVAFRNAVIALNSSGEFVEITGADPSLIAYGFHDLASADSLTGDGAKEAIVSSGCKLLVGSGLAQSDEGKTVFTVDDQTFSLSSNGGARPVMGVLRKFVSSTAGYVEIHPELSIARAASALVAGGASTELTIASGAVTATGSHHTIDTEADGASDNLDTISGGAAGRLYLIRPASAARTVVIRDVAASTTGNIYTPFAQSISLAEAEDWALLASDGTKMTVVGFRTAAANGGGAGAIVGLLASLTTTDKASVVAAVNEVRAVAIQAIKVQAVDATLVSGTVTISTVVVVDADSEVVAFPKGVITGSTNFGCVRELIASRVTGIAGVANLVIEAVGADGAKDVDAAGAVRVLIFTPLS